MRGSVPIKTLPNVSRAEAPFRRVRSSGFGSLVDRDCDTRATGTPQPVVLKLQPHLLDWVSSIPVVFRQGASRTWMCDLADLPRRMRMYKWLPARAASMAGRTPVGGIVTADTTKEKPPAGETIAARSAP